MSKWFLLLSLSFGALAAHDPHIPLELTFEESRQWLKSIEHEFKSNKSLDSVMTVEMDKAIEAGEILGKWLEKINEARAKNPIRLTSANTRVGIPISKPKKYGPSTVEQTHKEFVAQMPKEMFQVFFEGAAYDSSVPVSDEVFVEWGRKVSKHYQNAVRWTGMQRWRDYYTQRRFDDVRGYYQLKSIKNLNDKLDNYRIQTTQLQETLKTGLLGICLNTLKSEENCQREFNRYYSRNRLKQFKSRFWNRSKKLWQSFFTISNPRNDVVWNSRNPYLMEVPFLDPRRSDIANWLKTNVEDEFRRPDLGWTLALNYVTSGGSSLSRLEFKPNVTPHVTGGNLIVMDANTSLEEYEVKWTIRHEYGHILRLPDCYFEFYDPSENLMINYQLDTTDLMCSRAGDMNDRIYHELKRVYFR